MRERYLVHQASGERQGYTLLVGSSHGLRVRHRCMQMYVWNAGVYVACVFG